MDIAALSIALASGKASGNVSIAVASKIKEMTEQNGANLVNMMNSGSALEQSVTPHVGGNIDIRM